MRLRADIDLSGFSPPARVILTALKKLGMLLANNRSDRFVSGAPGPRWNDEMLHTLARVKGRDFEVVKMGPLMRR